MDETSQKIIDAAMTLVRDKGYVAMTTKDIAKLAEVNECTLFRKFAGKKEIVLGGLEQEKWRADITMEIFQDVAWELETDLAMFLREYMKRMTPDFVRLSIGLRAPQIYEETEAFIRKVPEAFLSALTAYFKEMKKRGKLPDGRAEELALMLFSQVFGFTFLDASFGRKLLAVEREKFIKQTVSVFLHGIL